MSNPLGTPRFLSLSAIAFAVPLFVIGFALRPVPPRVDPGQGGGSGSGSGAGRDLGPVITGVETAPPTPRTVKPGTSDAVKKLSEGLVARRKQIAASLKAVVLPGDRPVAMNPALGGFKEELFLEVIYLHELNAEFATEGLVPVQAAVARVDEASRAAGLVPTAPNAPSAPVFDFDEKKSNYAGSYTQWYALVCYALGNNSAAWSKGQEVEKLLDDLVARSASWSQVGQGRDHYDGSVACAALYAGLYLYVNSDLVQERVGQRLGTPFGNYPWDRTAVPDAERRLVKILGNVCRKVEESEPSLKNWPGPPATARLKYDAGEVNGRLTLAGGRTLYFLAKACIAYESADEKSKGVKLKERDDYLDLARLTVFEARRDLSALTAEQLRNVSNFNTYALTYLMRGATIYTRIYASPAVADYDKVEEMADWSRRIVDRCDEVGLKDQWSAFYRPLALLQYMRELEHARVVLSRPRAPEGKK